MFYSLRFRLLLICIGLAVCPLIIVGAVIGVRTYNTLEQQSLELQRKVAESVGIEIRATIGQWERELVLRDKVGGLGLLELKEQRAVLSSMLVHQRAFQEVALLDSKGQEQIRLSRTHVILDDDLQSRAGNEEFLFPATSGGTYLGPVRFDDTIREPLATISVPLFDKSSGEVVFVLVAESRFKAIWDLLNDIELTSGGEVYVINQAGQVIAHRHPAIVLRGTTIELSEVDGRAEGLSGTDVIVARHKLQFGNQELIVVAEQPVSNALLLANKNLGVMVSVIFSALALALILALLVTRRIVRPIEALATSALAIRKGDFSQQVEVSGRDEVGQLASAFNQMVSDLRTTTTSIDNLNKEITERKEIEKERRVYIAGIDNANEGIAFTKMNGDMLYFNKSACRIFGYTPAEMKEINISNFSATSADGKKLEGSLRERGQFFGEIIGMRKNGETFPATLSVSIVNDDKGKPIGRMGVFSDITERKQMEQQLQEKNEELKSQAEELMAQQQELMGTTKELERASQAKSDFLSSMSHELRTPLNAVIGFSELLLDGVAGKINAEQKDFITDILEGGEHLLDLINEVLDLSKIEARKMELRVESLDLTDIVTDVLQTMRPLLDDKKHKVSVSLETGLSKVRADKSRLRQVFFNLLGNAVKFTPPGGMLGIEGSSKDKWCYISVSDNGIGLREEDQERIFEPFTQGEHLTEDKKEGTGLGLALTKQFVEACGGRIWLESEYGKGSKFTFTLPLAGEGEPYLEKEKEKTAEGLPKVKTPHKPGQKPILKVDDDQEQEA